MLKVNSINLIDCQSVRRPKFKGSNAQYLDAEIGGLLADPEYVDQYISTMVEAQKTDLAGTNPIKAFVNKLVKTFKILYSPEITAEAENVKKNIDALIDAKSNLKFNA